MIGDEIRKKLQNIAGGTLLEKQEDHCTAIRNLLCSSFETGPTIKSKFESRAIIKKEQIDLLKAYARQHLIWMNNLPSGSQYLAQGGEATVYLAENHRNVIKVNAAVYYATWLEYFNSLLIHNLLFAATAYSLLGFIKNEETFSAVVQQPFVEGRSANLSDIKDLLTYNGFVNIKRQDYFNKEFGLLLEDMHDENVIARADSLFFVDTVFYIMEKK